MARTITLLDLQQRGACLEQRRIFQKLFGDSVEVTEELAEKHAQQFDWSWATISFLQGPQLLHYWDAEGKAYNVYVQECRKANVVRAAADYKIVKAKAFAQAYNMVEGP